MNLEAVILCLDTVLAETDEVNFKAWKRLSDEIGVDFDRETYQKMREVSRRTAMNIFFKDQGIPEEEIQAALDRQNNFYHELMVKMTPGDVLPGVLEILKALRSASIRIGICSDHEDTQKALDAVGLTPLVDRIGDSRSVKETLPEPDLLLYVAHEMGVKPENCVVFANQQKEIEAANRAGMYAIGIGAPEQLAGSDVVYPSFKSVTLDQINTDLEAARPY